MITVATMNRRENKNGTEKQMFNEQNLMKFNRFPCKNTKTERNILRMLSFSSAIMHFYIDCKLCKWFVHSARCKRYIFCKMHSICREIRWKNRYNRHMITDVSFNLFCIRSHILCSVFYAMASERERETQQMLLFFFSQSVELDRQTDI